MPNLPSKNVVQNCVEVQKLFCFSQKRLRKTDVSYGFRAINAKQENENSCLWLAV